MMGISTLATRISIGDDDDIQNLQRRRRRNKVDGDQITTTVSWWNDDDDKGKTTTHAKITRRRRHFIICWRRCSDDISMPYDFKHQLRSPLFLCTCCFGLGQQKHPTPCTIVDQIWNNNDALPIAIIIRGVGRLKKVGGQDLWYALPHPPSPSPLLLFPPLPSAPPLTARGSRKRLKLPPAIWVHVRSKMKLLVRFKFTTVA